MTEFKEHRRTQTFAANVDGTRNIVGICRKRLRGKFYHVSTAYICGTRNGVLLEELSPPAPAYADPYEESKHVGEGLVALGLDWTILRLGILLGDSETGEARTRKMVYGVVRTYWRLREVLRNKYPPAQLAALRKCPFIVEGRPTAAKNVLCMDDALHLFDAIRQKAPSGTVYRLVQSPLFNERRPASNHKRGNRA